MISHYEILTNISNRDILTKVNIMRKIVYFVLLIVLALSLTGCVDHNDGVCDYDNCSMTIGVVRYDERHELCLEHAINYDDMVEEQEKTDFAIIVACVGGGIVIFMIVLCILANKSSNDEPATPPQTQSSQRQKNNDVTPSTSTDVEREIRKFKRLLDEGLITQEEFDQKKKQILGI